MRTEYMPRPRGRKAGVAALAAAVAVAVAMLPASAEAGPTIVTPTPAAPAQVEPHVVDAAPTPSPASTPSPAPAPAPASTPSSGSTPSAPVSQDAPARAEWDTYTDPPGVFANEVTFPANPDALFGMSLAHQLNVYFSFIFWEGGAVAYENFELWRMSIPRSQKQALGQLSHEVQEAREARKAREAVEKQKAEQKKAEESSEPKVDGGLSQNDDSDQGEQLAQSGDNSGQSDESNDWGDSLLAGGIMDGVGGVGGGPGVEEELQSAA